MVDVFAVSSARRKRVEFSERKMTESDRKLFRKAKELELQSWLDYRGFDLVKNKFVDQERIMRARWVKPNPITCCTEYSIFSRYCDHLLDHANRKNRG